MDALAEQAIHAQRIAHSIGRGQLGVEVFGWAIRNAKHLPNDALKELLDMVTGEE